MQIYNQGKFIIKANLYLESKKITARKKRKEQQQKEATEKKNKAQRSRLLPYNYIFIVIQGFNIKTS